LNDSGLYKLSKNHKRSKRGFKDISQNDSVDVSFQGMVGENHDHKKIYNKRLKLLGTPKEYKDSGNSEGISNLKENKRLFGEYKKEDDSDDNKTVDKRKKERLARFQNQENSELEPFGISKKSKRPILGKYSDRGILEFIISKFSNIVEIFSKLFSRNNLDIASLAIMLACNLSKQISLMSNEKDEEISKNIESHFIKNFNKLIFKQESGKFFLISIIKYCIFVSYDKNKVIIHKSFYEHILNMFMDVENKVVNIELNKEDFLGNTINYILIESLLKFLNITIELNHKLKLFKEYTFTSIYEFYLKFLIKFTQILQELKLNIDNNYNLQDLIISILHILITFLKQDDFNYRDIEEYINTLISKLLSTAPSCLSEELKSIFIYFLYILINNNIDQKGLINKEDTIKWMMMLFQLMDNSLQTDYYCLKLFFKAIKNQDEKLVNLIWKSSKFLKKLYKYIIIFKNTRKEDSVYDEGLDIPIVKITSEKKGGVFKGGMMKNSFLKNITKETKDTKEIENMGKHSNLSSKTNNLQINSNINNAYKESSIEKLEKKSIIKKESEKIINILSFNTKSHEKLIETGIYQHFKNTVLEKYNPKTQNSFHKEEFILIVNIFLNKDNMSIVKEDIPSILPIIFLNKELNNNYKAQLFEIYLEDITAEKYFQEDYNKVFQVLYEGLKHNFSDIIFLLYSFMDKNELFANSVISDTNLLVKVFNDYLIHDPNFPSEVSELALFIKIVEMYINSNIYDESLQELIAKLILCLSRNSNKLKEIFIVQIITQLLFMLFQKYHQVDLNLCNEDLEAVQNFATKFNYSEIVTAMMKSALESQNHANIYFFIQEVLKTEENEYLLKGLNKSILYQKEFAFAFYGEITNKNSKNTGKLQSGKVNDTNKTNSSKDIVQSSSKNNSNNYNSISQNSIFSIDLINIKELVFFLNLTACLNKAKQVTFAEELIELINEIYRKILIIKEKGISIHPIQKEIILEEALSSMFFYFDFLVEANLSSQAFQSIMNFMLSICFNASINEEYLIVFVRYLQEIINKFSITTKDDIIIISTFLNKIHLNPKLCSFENSLVGTIIINSSKTVLTTCLDYYLNILSMYIKEYNSEKVYDFLEYFNQIYLSIVSEDKFELLKKLQRYLMTALEKHDKELKKDTNFKKKLEKIAKQLYAY